MPADAKEEWIPTPDGKIKSWVYSGLKREAIIFCHGFTGSSSGIFKPELAKILSQDYLVVRFDFLGNGESEGKFYDVTLSGEVRDLGFVVDYVRARYDPARIILLGHSWGAAVATLYASEHAVDGLVLLAATDDVRNDRDLTPDVLQSFDENGEARLQNWSKGGDLDAISRRYLDDERSLDILCAARMISAPALLIHGSEDDVVLPSEGRALADALGGPTEFNELPADHVFNFFAKPMTAELASIICSWLRKTYR